MVINKGGRSGSVVHYRLLDSRHYVPSTYIYMLAFLSCLFYFQEGGFFVECGAFTGEQRSNTLMFEKSRQWTGLLVEADPSNYKTLKSKNRKAFSVQACLNTEPHPAMV